MITYIILFKRYRIWFFLFLICFCIQVLFILLFWSIEKINKLDENTMQLGDKKFERNQFGKDYFERWTGGIFEIDRNLKIKTNEIYKSNGEQINCNTNDSFLDSAIERAETSYCKIQIKEVFCRHQVGQLYLETIADYKKCPTNSLFEHIGCFLNNRRPSTIDSYVLQYKKANKLKCSYLCIQLNTRYFGIENGTLCHCIRELPSEQLKIDSTSCNTFCEDEKYGCGGPYLISVFETGLRNNDITTKRKFDDKKVDKNEKTIKIAFLLSVNGRSLRQIKRLIKQIYNSKHVYFIHVDKQNDFLFDSLSDQLSGIKNLIITNERFYTIWGGSQLLTMMLNSFKLLLNYEWQYVINLSESDYPIKSLSSLENYLMQFRGKNFLKFHGQSNNSFVRKQGLQVLFLQCENKMWRLNKKRNLLKKVNFTGGSDWFALHRSFVNFIINGSNHSITSNHFLSNLKKFFTYTLLPAESFFHTLLLNSEFCTQLINNNLRITNWKRKIGCKCQYKHIVDWCGCSPNVFKKLDWMKLKSTLEKPLFFARKFDPLIDHEIINQIEHTYNRNLSVNVHKYWHNLYHSKYDKSLAPLAYTFLSFIALQECLQKFTDNYEEIINIQSIFKTVTVSNVNEFINLGEYIGTQISFNFKHVDQFEHSDLKFEILVSPYHYFKKYDDIDNSLKLVLLKVCTNYDLKEDFFRNFGCLIDTRSKITVQYKFEIEDKKLFENNTIYFVWIHEHSKKIILGNEIHLSKLLIMNKTNEINNYLFAEIMQPVHSGVWRLLLVLKVNKLVSEIIKSSNFKIKSSYEMKYINETNANNYIKLSNEKLNVTMNIDPKTKFDKILNDIMICDENKMQSRIIAETRFLVLDSNFHSKNNVYLSTYEKITQKLKLFWNIKDICLSESKDMKFTNTTIDKYRSKIKNCLNTTWSNELPDPKSHLVLN